MVIRKMKMGRVRSQSERSGVMEGRARLGMRSSSGPSPSRGAGMKVGSSVVSAFVWDVAREVEKGFEKAGERRSVSRSAGGRAKMVGGETRWWHRGRSDCIFACYQIRLSYQSCLDCSRGGMLALRYMGHGELVPSLTLKARSRNHPCQGRQNPPTTS